MTPRRIGAAACARTATGAGMGGQRSIATRSGGPWELPICFHMLRIGRFAEKSRKFNRSLTILSLRPNHPLTVGSSYWFRRHEQNENSSELQSGCYPFCPASDHTVFAAAMAGCRRCGSNKPKRHTMKNPSKFVLAALALGSCAYLTTAQSSNDPAAPGPDRPPRHAGGPGREGRRHGPPLVAALDVNRDGVIDATELANAPAAIKALDLNGDGKIDLDELAPPRPGGEGQRPSPPPHRPGRPPEPDGAEAAGQDQSGSDMAPPAPPMPPLLTALDANHDGVLDAAEIANASTALKALDVNGDGQLTPDEYRPKPPMHAGRAPGTGAGADAVRRPHAPRGHQPPPEN
jgi:hypothetical protein